MAAHLDHGLRPESGEDVAFCASLCAEPGHRVPARHGRHAGAGAARALRARGRRPPRALRLPAAGEAKTRAPRPSRWPTPATTRPRPCSCGSFAGPEPTGLSAMRPRNGDVIRPLLGLSRRAVRRHLEARGLGLARGSHERRSGIPAQPGAPRAPAPPRGPLQPAAPGNAGAHRLAPGRRGGAPRRAGRGALDARGARPGGEAVVDYRRAGQGAAAPGSSRPAPRPRGIGRPRRGRRPCTSRSCSTWSGPRRLRGGDCPFPAAAKPPSPGTSSSSVPAVPPAVPSPSSWGCRGGWTFPTERLLLAEAARGPAVSNGESAVVAAPEDGVPLVVRTRRPGDRVRYRGRDLSLKRFLVTRRVAAQSPYRAAPRGGGLAGAVRPGRAGRKARPGASM